MGRTIVVYGPLGPAETTTVRAAASSLGLEAEFLDRPVAVTARLDERLPSAVLVAWECDGAAEVLATLHGEPRYASVPVLGLAEGRTDLAFGELYRQGGDDLVSPRSLRALVARLRQVVADPCVGAPVEPRGHVLVAGTGLRERTGIGRMLGNAGLAPRFVNNAQDAVEQSGSADVRFVVAFDGLAPGGAAQALRAARSAGARCPWIVVAPTRRAASLRLELEWTPGVAVVDAYAPPDHILFVANDLLNPDLAERRSSARLLFGTSVSFRAAGAAEDDIGITYNIGASGLFVRTLAPLDAGQEVWLELWPPHTERAVRLVGRVAWRRSFGPAASATVPPGFGVAILGGLPGDLERWRAAYEALMERPAPPFRKEVWEHLSRVPPPLVGPTVS